MRCVRELTEETGYTGEIDDSLSSRSWTRGPLPDHGWGRRTTASRSSTTCASRAASFGTSVDESTDMAAWVSLDEVRDAPDRRACRSMRSQYLESQTVAVAD